MTPESLTQETTLPDATRPQWSHCDRAVWLGYRNATAITATLAMDTSRALEPLVYELLKNACYSVSLVGAELPIGKIHGVTYKEGRFALLVIKCLKSKYWKDWVKNGCPQNYNVTAQIQMLQSGQLSKSGRTLEQCDFVVLNKDTSEIHIDTIQLNPEFAQLELERLQAIAAREDYPPIVEEDFRCNMCKQKNTCKGQEFPQIKCGTCAHVSAEDGILSCQYGTEPCDNHVYHPHIVEAFGFKFDRFDQERMAAIYDKITNIPAHEKPTGDACFTSKQLRENWPIDEYCLGIMREFGARIE